MSVFDIDIAVERPSRRIALSLQADESVVAITGPSGIGKTSVLDAIAGLLRPLEGRIAVAGRVLFDQASGIDLKPEERGCGYVFQDSRLFPHLTVEQNLTFGLRHAEGEALTTLAECADLLGIAHLLARRPRALSGGETRRIAIGRALLRGPRFLLLDEPLASLDDDRREGILQVIERIRDRFALPMLYVSHNPEEVRRLAGKAVAL